MEIPASAFTEILLYLEHHPLDVGKSQHFGIVNKRSDIPDISRQCFLHPWLYHLLLDFAKKYIKIYWTGIRITNDSISKPSRDVSNHGNCITIGFGDYTGGELNVWDIPHDIRHKPLIYDGSSELHWTMPYTGTRYTLVFYTLNPTYPLIRQREDYDTVYINNEWKIKYTDSDGTIDYLTKNARR